MPIRLAAVASFVVFAVCLIAGIANPFPAAVGRALVAMMGTLVVGLVVGWMAQKMIEENLKQLPKPVPDAPEAAPEPVPASDNKGAKSAGRKDQGKAAKRGR